MPVGGARPGAGRKPGGVNRLAAEAVEKAKAGGLMPLDYMLTVLRCDLETDERRMDAAKAAAPYVHAKLTAVQFDGKLDADIGHSIDPDAARQAVAIVDELIRGLATGRVAADKAAPKG